MNKELIETLEKLAKEFEQKGKETKDSDYMDISSDLYRVVYKILLKDELVTI